MWELLAFEYVKIKRVGGIAVTTLSWWASRSFIRPAHMSSCIRPEVRFPLGQRILCNDSCKKM